MKREIKNASALIWLTSVDLGATFVRQVDVGDSANNGYALLSHEASLEDLRELWRFKENWRHQALPSDIVEAAAAGDTKQVYDLLELYGGGGSDHLPGPSRMISSCPVALPDYVKPGNRWGAGLQTQYSKWLVESFDQGSWLKTSAVASQRKARPKTRVLVDVPAFVPPVPETFADTSNFKSLWSRRWENSAEHINLKEARVALSSLKRTVRVQKLASCKKVTLSDNLVAISAFEKGRSNSYGLNRICQQSAAYQFVSGVRWRLRHIETLRNVADEPSRRFETKSKDSRNISTAQPAKARPSHYEALYVDRALRFLLGGSW